jgi:hypothetical protein
MRFYVIPVIIFYCLLSVNLYAQTGMVCSVRAIAISEADITGSSGWSCVDNPAGLGSFSHFSIGISYFNRYMVPELGTQSICTTLPTLRGTFSPLFSHFGSRIFNRMEVRLAYGLALNKWLSAGVRMGYQTIHIEAVMYRASVVTGDLALIVKPAENLAIGAFLVNPMQTKYNDPSRNRSSGNMKIGITYFQQDQFCLASSLNWEEFKRITAGLGSEYTVCSFLSLLAGVQFPDHLNYSFGIRISSKSFRFDVGFENHPVLGLSPALAFSCKIK